MLAFPTPLHIADIDVPHTCLHPGHLYAVVEEGAAALDSLLHATVAAAAAAAVRTAMLAPPAALTQLWLGAQGKLRQAWTAGALTLLAAPVLQASSLQRLAAELAHFAPDCALLLLDQAEALLASQPHANVAALRALRDWAEREGKAIVLLFRHPDASAPDPLARLRHGAALFAGLARLRRDSGGGLRWETFHWHHPAGMAGSLMQQLQRDGAAWRLAQLPGAAVPRGPAPDELRTVVAPDALLAGEQVPQGWQQENDLAAASAHSVAATFVLGFGADTGFETLARCLLSLRRAGGQRLKLVVRETGVRLRQSQEALLLRLGANLVVPAGVPLARLQGLCAAVQGQVFLHEPPASFEEAVAESLPAACHGYLAPARFVVTALANLERSHALRIESALVRLFPVASLTPLDVLRYCVTRRDGDVLSADERSVYVFLYACREGDVPATLGRLFRLPIAELFDAEHRSVSARDIGAACAELRRLAPRLPDLSAPLAAAPAVAPVPPPPAPDVPVAPAAQRAAPAPRAQRRPLPVLGATP